MVMSLSVAPLFWPTLYDEEAIASSCHNVATALHGSLSVRLSVRSWSSTKMAKRIGSC